METPRDPDERPTLRQALHSVTGDRDAEAGALADRVDDATEDDATEDDVTEDDAREAVRRAHGDLGVDKTPSDHDIATPADAEAVHDQPGPDAD